MTKDVEENDNINVSYLITGENDEEKIDAKLESPKGSIIVERVSEKGGDFKQVARETGTHKLCFFVPKPGENFISFEFFTLEEKGHALDMAKDGKIIFNLL